MAKGTIAKENLMARFKMALGNDYIGTEDDKKFYFWSTENGEKVQVAITMTVPKTPFVCEGKGGDLNFSDMPLSNGAEAKMEMDADEKATLNRLMKELGL